MEIVASGGLTAGPAAAVFWRPERLYLAAKTIRKGWRADMFVKSLSCCAILAGGVLAVTGLHSSPQNGCPGARLLAVICGSAVADDQKGDKVAVSGIWRKKNAELTIEFAENDVMRIAPHGDGVAIAIVCDYTAEKEGPVKATVARIEADDEEVRKKVEGHVPVGLVFRFRWNAKDDSAKLDEVQGDNVDALKSHLEGDFEKKK